MAARVFVTRSLPAEGMKELEGLDIRQWDRESEPVPPEVLREQARDADGILTMLTDKISGEFLDECPRLKVVANCAVGYDNIDVEACTERNVLVTNTPGVLTGATADLAFGLLLAAARRIVEGEKVVRTGQWKTWSLMFMAGPEVHHSTLGIIGFGKIGQAVAQRARGFDMKVLYWDARRVPELERAGEIEYRELDQLLAESDFVSIHLPLSEQTRGLVGKRELRLMKPTAILVNTARGPIVVESDLIEALKEGVIAGAALDVMEKEPIGPGHPLLDTPNVVLTPHIGSAALATRQAMARTAAINLKAVMDGHEPPNMVNAKVWPVCLQRNG